VRIRGSWIAVPTLAVLGAVGYTSITSWLGAQEPPAAATPPAFGYYPPKVSPAPPGLLPGRPATPGAEPAPTSVNGQTADWSQSRTKLTTPVVAGPDVAQVPVRQLQPIRTVSASEPVNVPPPRVNLDVPSVPKLGAELPQPTIAPPALFQPSVAPIPGPNLSNPTPVPAPSPVGMPLAPPKISVESTMPEPGPRLESKPIPLTPPTPTNTLPLPTIPSLTGEPAGPALLKPVAAAAAPMLSTSLSPSSSPMESSLPKLPTPATTATTSFPVSGLATKNTPTVVLEAVAPESVSVNQPLVYELVVRNTGVAAVNNVRVDEEPPAGTKFLSSEPVAEQTNGRLVWLLGSLEAGAEKRIKISVKPADEGEIRSRAVVSFSAATEARVKVTRPKLNLTMNAVETVRVGDEVLFNIRVTNTGTGPAAKMMLQANLTDGLNHAQGSIVETELANLPAGESRTITLRTLATKAGAQQCQLSVVADGNPAETAKASLAIVEPMLQAKLAGPAKCLVRSEPEYKIELANPGTAATDPIVTTIAIPEGFDYVSASDSGTFNSGTRNVTWKLPSLASNTKKELGLKLRATSIAEGSLKVFAQASSLMETGENSSGLAQASARVGRTLDAKAEGTIKAEGVPAIRFEVADLEDPVEVGKEAIYEIKVMNQGTAPCTNVQISATLAEGTSATGANGPTQARGQGQQVTFDPIVTLAIKQEMTFKVKVKGGVAGDQRFRVQIVCDQIRTPISKEESTRFVKD
jgi:uncharacterized repeat protein (TIGR01451 family)